MMPVRHLNGEGFGVHRLGKTQLTPQPPSGGPKEEFYGKMG
jgi:hypothetical protein